MIKVNKGNLLTNVKSGIIVHGCNAQGVMGAGFALAVREMYPEAYKEYKMLCNRQQKYNEDPLGKIVTVEVTPGLYIVNAITQRYYGREKKVYVDYDAVKTCFAAINNTVISIANVKTYNKINQEGISAKEYKKAWDTLIPEVHFPMIGAGLGGGDWSVIEKIIDEEIPDDVSKNLWVL